MGAFAKDVVLWNGGIIVYQSNKSHPFWTTIEKAIKEINRRTIIKFVEMNKDDNKDVYGHHFILFACEQRGNFASIGQKPESVVNIDKNVRALHEHFMNTS